MGQIYAKEEFESLVRSLSEGITGKTFTAETGRAYLGEEISELLKEITRKIQKSHPNYALENLLAKICERVPHVVQVVLQGGAGDHGADIILTIEEGLPFGSLTVQKKCVVQVKSFEGDIWDTTAVSDIERAYEYYPDAGMGLIVTTAENTTEPFEKALENLRLKYPDKPVGLLFGKDVARVVLQYGMELIP
jgi:Restriction endonuclease